MINELPITCPVGDVKIRNKIIVYKIFHIQFAQYHSQTIVYATVFFNSFIREHSYINYLINRRYCRNHSKIFTVIQAPDDIAFSINFKHLRRIGFPGIFIVPLPIADIQTIPARRQ